MQIYHRLTALPAAAFGRGSAVALGFFDGVHIGHRAVISAAVDCARAEGLEAAVFTFSLPAGHAMKGGRLITDEEKHRRVGELGADHFFEPAFEEFCDLSPEAFVADVLAGLYNAKAVFCGDNFTFGKKAAALTIVGDIGKGVAAVLLAKWFFGMHLNDQIYFRAEIIGIYLAAFFAVIGHVYPVYFGFKGGKAVSVATGTIAAIEPLLLVPLVVIFFSVLFLWKMVSLASICCAAAYPVLTFLYYRFWLAAEPAAVAAAGVGSLIVAALVIWLHRSNIGRIRAGTEYKFFQKKH